MTLNETWEECLRMWKWISRNAWRYPSIQHAKCRWLELNGYDLDKKWLVDECFFCEYATKAAKRGKKLGPCKYCPAAKVESGFTCGRTPAWYENPKAFYLKLVELNKIRLGEKK